jgi:putative ABC transport system permease protein
MSPDREIITPSVDKRVRSELAFHIEMRTRELVEQGMSPEDARREAVRRFGNLDAISADMVKIGRQTEGIMRRARFITEATQDARAALRLLARRRSFAALAIGTLALGIGAATAIYSVVDGVLLRPLPFEEPDRIAAVWITQPTLATDPVISRYAYATPVGNEEYQALRRGTKTFQELALYTGGFVTLNTDAGSQRIPSLWATSSLFRVLRVNAAVGRAFQPEDNVLNGPNLTMLSWESWRTRFGGDTAVIGRRVTLNDTPYEIIGVLPPGVRVDRSAEAPEFWLPALRDSGDLVVRRNRNYKALARLAPGATYSVATLEVAQVLRSLGDTTLGARVEVWQHDQTSAARGPLLLLLGAAALLMVIACVNVAILQLGEAAARAREMATRAAMGAGVGRLIRQLLVESTVLSLVSALLGTVLASLMIRGLVAIAPERLPGMDTVSLDARVLTVAMLSAAVTGLLFGIVPAILAGRAASGNVVRSGVGEGGRGTRTIQRSLIALQLGLSMVLLVEATLLSRSLRNLSEVDPGFQPVRLTAVRVARSWRSDDDQVRSFTRTMLERLRSYPGVEAVTASTGVPFVSGSNSSPVELDHVGDVTPAERRHTQQRYVMPGYFETIGMRLVSGRFFNADDRPRSELVAIVSTSEVARDFGGQSPLGRRVKHQGKWRRIVGVVADVKYRELAREDEATLYVPFDQFPDATPVFVIRGDAGPNLQTAISAILREVEPRATVISVTALPGAIAKSYAVERYRAVLVSAFGIMAALLAAIGLYGVSLRSARRRTREIGIRLAIGATSFNVLRLLVSDAMQGVAIGLAIGTPAALLAARLVSPYLFKIAPNDPFVFAGVALLLIIATAMASAIPARRAAHLDPSAVLRAE